MEEAPSIVTPGKVIGTKTITPRFGNYITRNDGFVAYLAAVRDQIETYITKLSVKRPLNILLAAPPGSGKSFLIKQLIASIDGATKVSFEEVYIASLENTSELYSIFQRVQSINLEGKIPVVFFDEIDSEIGGSTLYAKFLAPMWDGTFYLGKEKFYLGRSIFFFAGSTLSLEQESKEIIASHCGQGPLPYEAYFEDWKEKFDEIHQKAKNKLPDFMDRIDAIVRIPPINDKLLGQECQAEYDDLAIMLILKHFPGVKYVGKWALEIISKALKGTSVRTAEKIVFNSSLEESENFEFSCLSEREQRRNQPPKPDDLVDGKEKFVWKIDVRKPS